MLAQRSKGKVYLIGAGPGDPELLTLKALNILKTADIIFYDSLLNKKILDYAPSKCRRTFVGKRYKKHSFTQSELNQLLYKNVSPEKIVVRLKGGDPFIFARGGEELEFLQENGIKVEIIPGVTSAMAAAASLKIPLTHRDHGQSVIFLSGYSKFSEENPETLPNYDWGFLAKGSITLVFYMGLKNLDLICAKLISHGKSEDTKAAIISNASLENEKKVVTTLKNLSRDSQRNGIEFPCIILIGEVIENAFEASIKEIDSMKKNNRYRPLKKVKDPEKLLLLVFHGARLLQDSNLPQEFIDHLKVEIKHPLIRYSFLTESIYPSMEQAVEEALNSDSLKSIDVFPIFLLPGKHLDDDIPKKVKYLQKKYRHLRIKLWPAPHIIKNISPVISDMASKILNQ